MADTYYHETHNKVELAFALAALPSYRIAMHIDKNNPQKLLFGRCLLALAETLTPLAWYDVHRKSHFTYQRCAICNSVGWHHDR